MMPGLQIYRALGGALQLARQMNTTDLQAVAGTLGNALQSCLVVGTLVLGLLVGARTVLALAEERNYPAASSIGSNSDRAYSPNGRNKDLNW
jgi:hypothetical protein